MRYVSIFFLSIFLLSTLPSNVDVFGGISAVRYTWVSVAGPVHAYGSYSAQGWIHVFVDVGYWSDGGCAFTVPPLGTEDILIHPAPSFNFTLYLTRIVDASTVELDFDSSNLFVAGVWEINSVTDPDSATDVHAVTENMTTSFGELRVTGNWTHFTIDLDGYVPVQGNITSYCIREIEAAQKRYPYGDVDYDFKIDMVDVSAFAAAFGSPLGYERYNFLADVNFDLKVDMRDLAICASRFGIVY